MGFAGPGVVVGCAVVGAVVVIGKQRLGVGVGVDTAASGMGKRRLVVGGGVGTTGITGTASGEQRLGVDPGAAQVGHECTGSFG